MQYKIQSTEKLRKYGAENETKALFYLMGSRKDSKEIYYFVVDVFNDLTGMSRLADKMWDLQSKGDKSPSPKTVGKELVTLYKNYLSSFEFEYYIIFLGGVSTTLRKDDTVVEFGISNVKDDAIKKMKDGLKEECNKKTYIDSCLITDNSINKFLEKILFVVVSGDKDEYVKRIIKLSDKVSPKKEVLIAIFNEVRDMQDAKKNIGVVEGKILQNPDEALNFGRHLKSNEITLLVLNRILNQNVINSRPPMAFIDILNSFPEERRKEILEDCQNNLARALFNVNEQEEFWRLLESIYCNVLESAKNNIDLIYQNVDRSILKKCTDFDVLTVKYFISVVKDGIQI